MFTIKVETSFNASHQLPKRNGVLEPVHEHNWKIEASVSSEKLNQSGCVMDFNELKEVMNQITWNFQDESFDKIEYFRQNSQSAEVLAEYLYQRLEQKLTQDVLLNSITVTEQSFCRARFSK